MAYRVVSEISNTSGRNLNTLEEFYEWYFDPYFDDDVNIIKNLDDSGAAYNTMLKTIRSVSWDAGRQIATVTRTYIDLSHYNQCVAIINRAGTKRSWETIVEEVEV